MYGYVQGENTFRVMFVILVPFLSHYTISAYYDVFQCDSDFIHGFQINIDVIMLRCYDVTVL